ncbi:MAG: TIGR04086 family membrane protein [Bacilli bacterium]|nr:TIGR04086 family membrane protein [Bacilli bacterium]
MKYLKSLGLFFGSFIILNILITIFNYFELFNSNIIKILKIITIIIPIVISGIYLGSNSNKKGYLEGLKLGGIIIAIFTLLTLILKPITFNKFTWLYYLIILGLEVGSSMIGINKKKSKN